jgi:hypothetical protein
MASWIYVLSPLMDVATVISDTGLALPAHTSAGRTTTSRLSHNYILPEVQLQSAFAAATIAPTCL